jgi:radical SAM protein with 4Fe4S-binding SPASM domain
MKFQHPSRPLRFELELTTNCMNRCSVCGDALIHTKGVYMKDWKIIIDKIKSSVFNTEYSCSIRLTGGEPTLHPEFFEIVAYIEKAGISHSIFTTGCYDRFDAERLFATYEGCKHFGSFLISLHGADSRQHELFTRRKGSFDEACKYIKQATSRGLVVVTNSVLTSHSANSIESIACLSKSLGAKAALFERLFTKDGELEPSETELVSAIAEVEKLRTDKGLNTVSAFCLPRCFHPTVKDTIKSGFEIATISTLGVVRPSNLTTFSYGNILTDSLESIWASPKADTYRNKLKPQCLECSELALCRGGIKHMGNEGVISFDAKIKENLPYKGKRAVDYELNLESVPKAHFQLINDNDKYLLACHSSSIVVNESALPVINDILTQKPLKGLKEIYGEYVLSLIAYLHQNQFVELEVIQES